ncbi:hypothetical protein CVT24_003401 [Panaeolus cyanescens]|uniref:Uncharacterized protein n=1 Tax=Panaeolus cyanescens TaxID=181874 RepID=A0A409Y737_9AGAR|nr:hypothetical protein CVT24_003401 [Panaeolus cyanescens]
MYQVLAQHGFPLKSWQKTDGVDMPYRYCIVNRHLVDNKYEVFLLTTFGGARTANDLSILGKQFGMPLGNTGWINNVKPLQTWPPIHSFGLQRKSFVFTIPFIATIDQNDTDKRLSVGGRVHLLGSDLQRLQNFSRSKIPILLANHKAIFRDLYSHKQGSVLALDSKDTPNDVFSPTLAEFESSLEDLSEGIQEWEVRKTYHIRTVAPQRLPNRSRLDFRWVNRYATTDIKTSSSFLRNKLPRQPVKKTLPPPFFASCLRVGVKSFARRIP